MKLSEWAATTKKSVYDNLIRTGEPGMGQYDQAALKECLAKGSPQVGTTMFEPDLFKFEFIFRDSDSTIVLVVNVAPPERIVFMPVPDWVVESVWQGHVEGSHHFESHAREALATFATSLEPGPNKELFGPRQAVGRQ